MPSKRVSRGRRKGGKGSTGVIQCTNCGQTVPKDKAKKVTSRLSLVEHQLAQGTYIASPKILKWYCLSLVEHQLAKELRAQGTYIASPKILKWYCISCAIHFKILKIRSSSKRREHTKLR